MCTVFTFLSYSTLIFVAVRLLSVLIQYRVIHFVVYTDVCVCMRVRACAYVCMYACIMYICMYYVFMHVYMYIYICIYVCMHVWMYACTYACIYVYMHASMYACMDVFFMYILFTACSITYNPTCLRDHIHVYSIYILSYYTPNSILFIF